MEQKELTLVIFGPGYPLWAEEIQYVKIENNGKKIRNFIVSCSHDGAHTVVEHFDIFAKIKVVKKSDSPFFCYEVLEDVNFQNTKYKKGEIVKVKEGNKFNMLGTE